MLNENIPCSLLYNGLSTYIMQIQILHSREKLNYNFIKLLPLVSKILTVIILGKTSAKTFIFLAFCNLATFNIGVALEAVG